VIGKQKTGVLMLLLMLLSLLTGCGHYQTYDELEAEAAVTSDKTKLEKRDDQAEKALQFFEYKTECLRAKNLVWICTRGGVQQGRIRNRDVGIDGMIKQYRREKGAGCTCGTQRAARDFMKSLGF